MGVVIAVIISVMPVVAWPWYMSGFNFSHSNDIVDFLAFVFPVYIILCAYLAYKCYNVRHEITYILLSIIWLSYGAALFL